ncbi:MAG TPA: Sec-independent protein translocase protein TatB [Methyloceanibacter sp.]|jgi:sec-independent protein translocase protein TatB|nr:Sec-independent protein translocase protein TatB [Methyloceanibacter sp.]
MFDIGWSELLVIAVVAIIVVGPKELPRLMRTFGHYVGKLRRMAADFQRQFEEAVRDSEIDEVRKAMQDFHAQASDMNLSAAVDKPLMVPKPAPPASAPAEAAPAPKPKPKPRAKKPKTTAAKKTVVAETNSGTKPAPAPKPRARKPKERTP